MRFFITLTQGEDGYIIAECPSLDGCVTQGKTKEEAMNNIKEAIELSIGTRKANNLPIPLEIEELEVAV